MIQQQESKVGEPHLCAMISRTRCSQLSWAKACPEMDNPDERGRPRRQVGHPLLKGGDKLGKLKSSRRAGERVNQSEPRPAATLVVIALNLNEYECVRGKGPGSPFRVERDPQWSIRLHQPDVLAPLVALLWLRRHVHVADEILLGGR
jgi:hypothetical protein